jgi:hypothetical protein
VRQTPVRALPDGWADDPATAELLLGRATTDTGSQVRKMANDARAADGRWPTAVAYREFQQVKDMSPASCWIRRTAYVRERRCNYHPESDIIAHYRLP